MHSGRMILSERTQSSRYYILRLYISSRLNICSQCLVTKQAVLMFPHGVELLLFLEVNYDRGNFKECKLGPNLIAFKN